jgi:hypothetical protein
LDAMMVYSQCCVDFLFDEVCVLFRSRNVNAEAEARERAGQKETIANRHEESVSPSVEGRGWWTTSVYLKCNKSLRRTNALGRPH